MARLLDQKATRAIDELVKAQAVQDCLQFFAGEKQWINERHIELCRIPAPTFLEERRAEWMAAQFAALGWHVEADGAGNVIARPDAARTGPYIALTAHLDTVLSPRNPEDIKVEPDGKFTGPGVSDNGAGLAALLAVARAWKLSCPVPDSEVRLLLVANVGEEGEGNLSGMRYLCNKRPLADLIQTFVVLDGPATDHITCQALESRRFEVSFAGPGGHSWSDHGIGNPVHALGRAIAFFCDLQTNGGPSGHARTSFNFGIIDGGASVNSIPTSARAKLDIRSENGARMDEMCTFLSTSVQKALEVENDRASKGRVSARIREIGARPGGVLPEDSPILSYVRAADAWLGLRARLDCASTDANIPLSMSLPAISIGAGGQGGGAHTPGEWYQPEGRDLGLQRILLTLCLLMREPAVTGG
ncbi:MAG TPA: M20/M25/M40 family metallo-hydrolase [Bryobacteraceae bacterium]|nr:M20/M25/M40 family metallo-hydrolase [Bryobacteraceae bacterium]